MDPRSVRVLDKSWILIGLIVVLINVQNPALAIVDDPLPEISIRPYRRDYSGQQDGLQNVNLTKNAPFVDIDFEVTEDILSLDLHCEAPYPVQWSLHSIKYVPTKYHGVHPYHARLAGDAFDSSTYEFLAVLQMYPIQNFMTGRYTCHSSRNQSVYTNVYLYWPGTSSRHLLVSRKNITLKKEDVSDDEIVFPCMVSKPEFGVSLYKFTANGKNLLMLNESISFHPKIGFRLLNLPDPAGFYQCVTSKSDWSSDYLGITVPSLKEPNMTVPTNGTTVISPTKKPKPTLTIDHSRWVVMCCSGTTKSPTLYNMACDHPTSCEFLKEAASAGLEMHYALLQRGQSSQAKNRGCSTMKLARLSLLAGIIRCVGPGFDLMQDYVYSYGPSFGLRTLDQLRPQALWTSWSEINPENLLLIENEGFPGPDDNLKPRNDVIYEGEILRMRCSPSPYYFSGGLLWGVRNKNLALTVFNNVYDPNYRSHFGVLDYPADDQVEAIICMAPVWNSSLWVHKIYYPYVNQSVPVTVQDLSPLRPSPWYTNETEHLIMCNATGAPPPTFTWFHDSSILENGTNTEITERTANMTNDTRMYQSIVKIRRVSHLTAGEYMCEARNLGRIVYSSVFISVLERHNVARTLTITFGTIFALVFVTAIGLILWKIRTGQLFDNSPGIPMPSGQAGGDTVPPPFPASVRHTTAHHDPALGENEAYNHTFDNTTLRTDLLD